MTTRRTRALAVAGAVASTVLLWTLARLVDVDLRVDPRDGREATTVALPFAAAVTLGVALLGWGTRAVLDRLTRHAAMIWTVLAVGVLLLSFLPVFSVGASAGTRLVLAAMHVGVAAVLVPVLGNREQREERYADAS